jgi:ubiquinone/menaquinone biosynthesis C-methylase UbiE
MEMYCLQTVSKGQRDLAVDIGAGTGQASVPLASHFKKVIAFDPSPGQLEQASKIGSNINPFSTN